MVDGTAPEPGLAAVRGSLRPTADVVAVRVVARLRVLVAVVVAAAGSFLPSLTGRQSALFLVIGLLWVPWASAVLFAADRPGSRLATLGGPLGDLVALFAFQTLLPDSGVTPLLGYLVVIAFGAYTSGRTVAGLLAALAMALTLVAQLFTAEAQRLDLSDVALLGAACAALVVLLDRTTTVQRRVTARSERIESKSDAVLSRVADGVFVTDATGHVVQCNPAAQRLLGRPDHGLLGFGCHEVLRLHVGERPLDCSRGCPLVMMSEEADTLGLEVWREHPNGTRQPLLANVAAVPATDGTPVEVIHSVRDITRLKQAEEAKTMFLATASHELKTPLTVIRGFAQTLLEFPGLDAARRLQALDAILSRAVELSNIIDRLLLSSRIEAGRVTVAVTDVAVEPLVSERVTALRIATGRAVTWEAHGSLPCVQADAHGLVTVVDHLLDNALKYSPTGAPVVVSAVAADHHVSLHVRDGGVGMEPDQAARCFDKFWQAESTDVRRFGGTGIGLYIVKSLVDAMGGNVEVCSTVGVGSTFSVTLREAGTLEPLGAGRAAPGMGEVSSIREFMRQLGVPDRSAT